MSLTTTKLALGLLFSLTALNAQAALTSYYAVGNIPVVYSSVSNVTWTQDANLFKTMYDADNSLISQIASVTPSYNDPADGSQTIEAGHFSISSGRMTWWGGLAFTDYLNSINYGGSSQWRLPSAGANPQLGFNQTGSELGQLFYSELGGTAFNSIPNTPTFNNEQSYAYWLATEYPPDPYNAWLFLTYNGGQDDFNKSSKNYAWAVSPGQVPAIPIPGALWLMGSGLIGLLSLRMRIRY
ncbi:DUF1566 domain-containing protein [Methylicorpusculum oleiharenae]|uniref:Lcl C-terminal domain-containing protein n=1 Tax=Methylicorpusculum oleiharenae TaxID=1338687 RepID=UPI00135977C8|nr:DUF1566 domain-containing protein [Methylicorpusculum oleiharenae]MCD2449438.1 DUF1566 domain-containing protein [Methylicorpusculum oleiharenae]